MAADGNLFGKPVLCRPLPPACLGRPSGPLAGAGAAHKERAAPFQRWADQLTAAAGPGRVGSGRAGRRFPITRPAATPTAGDLITSRSRRDGSGPLAVTTRSSSARQGGSGCERSLDRFRSTTRPLTIVAVAAFYLQARLLFTTDHGVAACPVRPYQAAAGCGPTGRHGTAPPYCGILP